MSFVDFRLWHERKVASDPEYAKAVADLEAQLLYARQHPGLRLHLADWLGTHLPFRWIPGSLGIWINNNLAHFMWETPGFDVEEPK